MKNLTRMAVATMLVLSGITVAYQFVSAEPSRLQEQEDIQNQINKLRSDRNLSEHFVDEKQVNKTAVEKKEVKEIPENEYQPILGTAPIFPFKLSYTDFLRMEIRENKAWQYLKQAAGGDLSLVNNVASVPVDDRTGIEGSTTSVFVDLISEVGNTPIEGLTNLMIINSMFQGTEKWLYRSVPGDLPDFSYPRFIVRHAEIPDGDGTEQADLLRFSAPNIGEDGKWHGEIKRDYELLKNIGTAGQITSYLTAVADYTVSGTEGGGFQLDIKPTKYLLYTSTSGNKDYKVFMRIIRLFDENGGTRYIDYYNNLPGAEKPIHKILSRVK